MNKPHSVENGVWRASSVSQLKSLNDCGLKWWFDKVQHLPRKPESKNQKIGTQGHSEVEHYLRTGQDVLGKFARAGKRFLPPPIESIEVERRFCGQHKDAPFDPARATLRAGGVPLDGFIDIVDYRFLTTGGALYEGGPEIPARTLVLTDHKFSSNINPTELGGYAAGPEDLISAETDAGIQMMGYAEWARLTLQGFDRVCVQHIYYSNKSPRARSVCAIVDLAHVEREWFIVNQLAARGVQAASETDPLKVPFNEGSCEKFRGCDYAGACPRSPINRLFNGVDMSLENMLPGKEEWVKASEAEAGQSYFVSQLGVAGTANGSGPNGVQFVTPSGAELVPLDTQVIPVAQAAAPVAEEPAPVKKSRAKKATEPEAPTPSPAVKRGEVRLYVGCRPDAGSIRLDDYIADAVSRMATKFNTKDIRIAPRDTTGGVDRNSPIAFGGWKGILAAYVRFSPPAAGNYHVIPGTEFNEVVIEALSSILPPENVVRAS